MPHRKSNIPPEEWRQAIREAVTPRRRKYLYREYLHTKWWRKKRSSILDMAAGICEVCEKRKATQAHHVTYERLAEEFDEDIVVCCKSCHMGIHRTTTLYPKNYRVLLRRRVELNDPDKTAIAYTRLLMMFKYLTKHPRRTKEHKSNVLSIREELNRRKLANKKNVT